jgi:eukaryotic-like serine/threonine-protein kinase
MSTPAPIAFAPGTTIAGKYRVERTIGGGGMGVVLEVTHLTLGQRVAMKVLREEGARSPEHLARFLREARIAARLPDEHVARVTDVGQTEEGLPYLVMELLNGRDLQAELAARGKLPIAEAVDCLLQACQGVAEAHAVGLVHRDLKPANLFLVRRRGGTDTVKVLDFGVSKMEDKGGQLLTITSSILGTPQYMSPEQIRSAKHVDARTDQHALAMILYEMLTLEPPYKGEIMTAILVAVATRPPPRASALRPEVPPELDAAIIRALAKEPKDRFPDLGGFAAAIAPFGGPGAAEAALSVQQTVKPLFEEPTLSYHRLATPVSTPTESGLTTINAADPWGRGRANRRKLWGAAGVLAAALTALGIWSLVKDRTAPSASPAPSGIVQSTTPTDTASALPREPVGPGSEQPPVEMPPRVTPSGSVAPPGTTGRPKPGGRGGEQPATPTKEPGTKAEEKDPTKVFGKQR